MVVEDANFVDVHLVGLEIDASFEIGVVDAGGFDVERGLLDTDRAGRPRVAGAAGDVDLGLQRPGDVGERGRKPLHQTEVDRAAVDVQVVLIPHRTI